mmetsp:Transcript_37534/g.75695  ORF Transcript_37534/g.75695 Transcript_37534/m.75695 type:complete len:325 (+) Transcript_37534:1-975(+)
MRSAPACLFFAAFVFPVASLQVVAQGSSSREARALTPHTGDAIKLSENSSSEARELGSTARTEAVAPHPSSVVLFVHLPKCAGTTIENVLLRTSPHLKCAGRHTTTDWHKAALSKCGSGADWDTAYTQMWKQLDVVVGHIGWGVSPRFLESKPFITTMLREPIDRLISYWNYNAVGQRHFKSKIKTSNYTFHDALSDSLSYCQEAVVQFYPCGQTQYRKDFSHSILWNEMTYWLSGYNDNRKSCVYDSTESALTKAKSNLMKTDVIGLTEDFPDYVRRLRKALPWLPPAPWPHANKGIRVDNFQRSELTSFEEQVLRERLARAS